MLKNLTFIVFFLICRGITAQNVGSISSGSKSSGLSFSVGEIVIQGSLISGSMGVYSYLIQSQSLTSLVDLTTDDGFIVSPNPTSGNFEIKSAAESIADIRIINASGQLVRQISNQANGDIRDLPTGQYYIYINQKRTFKIIKQ